MAPQTTTLHPSQSESPDAIANSPHALRAEVEALRVCVDILRERERADAERAWLWAGRRRVAKFCLRSAEIRFARMYAPLRVEASSRSLPAHEIERLIRSHHLLQGEPHADPHRAREDAKWMDELLMKVRLFAHTLAARKSSGASRD